MQVSVSGPGVKPCPDAEDAATEKQKHERRSVMLVSPRAAAEEPVLSVLSVQIPADTGGEVVATLPGDATEWSLEKCSVRLGLYSTRQTVLGRKANRVGVFADKVDRRHSIAWCDASRGAALMRCYAKVIGEAIVPLADLVRRPTRTLLLVDPDGDAVTSA
jgi:hypothetical protein